MPRVRIGIDVGGTFTDLVLVDDAGKTIFHKLPSSPGAPHLAPIQGIVDLLGHARVHPQDVAFVGLGTTVATNMFLERKGAPTGLLTTEGFRDLLEIGRQQRPSVFDPFMPKPAPLIPREHRFGIRERVTFDGHVLMPLAEDEVIEAANRLRDAGLISVAICFLHSYANPMHEQQAAAIVRDLWPDVHLVTSEALVPEFREYERLTTTVLNAYLLPGMRDYIDEFSGKVRDLGISSEPLIMSSSGGALRALLAARRPVDTLFSGPSGGVSGSAYISAAAGVDDTINFDMGGTSTEVCVVHHGRPEVRHYREIESLPLRSTAIAVETIGAGGSSVAYIDEGGFLRVGPESVGADPGPACYDRGGARPTVTDANVVLGRLNPEFLLGGTLPIDRGRAVSAIEGFVAKPLGIGVADAANAILAVSNNNIANAIRLVSTGRGLDPADYTLVAYGGAGPLHAAFVAAELGISKILIPAGPGILCAFGVLTKDVAMDLSVSRVMTDDSDDVVLKVHGVFGDLERRARDEFTSSGASIEDLQFVRTIDARYFGQNFELPVLVDLNDDALHERVRSRFHEEHRKVYGFVREASVLELVTFRLQAILPTPRPMGAAKGSITRPHGRAVGSRTVVFEQADRPVACEVYDRTSLADGQRVSGPTIIEQMDTTTVVPSGFSAVAHSSGNLLLLSDERLVV
jgi:N-methylhydantoinase A